MTQPSLTPAGRRYLEMLTYAPEFRDEEPLTPCYRKLRDEGLVAWTGKAVEPTKAGLAALGLVAPKPAAGRPSSQPRLLELDPLHLADQLDERIKAHLRNLATLEACPCSPGAGRSPFSLAFARFVQATQRGEQSPQPYQLAGLVGVLLPYLRQTPAGELDTSDPVALVLAAALARKKLELGNPLHLADLAALSGLHPKAIRLLARQGKLALQPGEDGQEAPAPEARRWLRSRDVLGV